MAQHLKSHLAFAVVLLSWVIQGLDTDAKFASATAQQRAMLAVALLLGLLNLEAARSDGLGAGRGLLRWLNVAWMAMLCGCMVWCVRCWHPLSCHYPVYCATVPSGARRPVPRWLTCCSRYL